MISTKPIFIEALTLGNDSGLGKINRILLNSFEKILAEENVVLISRQKQAPFINQNWKHLHTSAKPLRFWVNIVFPLTILKFKPRLIICLGFNMPAFLFSTPCWLLVCDVGPLENLPFRTSKFDRANKKRFPHIIAKADTILTISEFTKSRINATTRYPLEKIEAFKPIGPESFSISDLPPDTTEINVDREFIFCHGNLEPRKNHLSLIRGYSLLLKQNGKLPKLIIAGHKAWGYPELKNEIKNLSLEDKVILTGYLSKNKLKAYMESCIIYMSCSLYEGWGFPLFEALEKERPAIFHTDSSQNEFAEEFAVGIDCSRPENIAAALSELLDSGDKRRVITDKLKTDFKKVLQYDLSERLKHIFISHKLIS